MVPYSADDKYRKQRNTFRQWLTDLFLHPGKRLLLLIVFVLLYLFVLMTVFQSQKQQPLSGETEVNLVDPKPSKFNPRPDTKKLNQPEDIKQQQQPDIKQIVQEVIQQSDRSDKVMLSKVKNMMKHAWQNYEQYAWGKDELRPVSKTSKQWLGQYGLAATMIDALDTLWIMDMKPEFEKAKEYVLTQLNFDIPASVSFFETTIRILGGLNAAYELEGDEGFLWKAKEIADRLLPAFQSKTGIPKGVVNLRSGYSSIQSWSNGAILAEYGSIQLEFQYLSQQIHEPIYAQKALQAMDYALEKEKPLKGLYPTTINADTGEWQSTTYTIGALADSFYEYLLKLWLVSDKKDYKYRQAWEQSADAIIEHLVRKSSTGNLFLGAGNEERVEPAMEHLTCFAGGMFALGAISKQEGDWQLYFEVGQNLTETCYLMYAKQPLGIGAEKTDMNTWQPIQTYYILRPEVIESIFYMWRLTHDEKYRQWGREIINSLETYCRVEGGYSGLHNMLQKGSHNDAQESFFLAETLKYLYLLYTDDSVIDLDEFVFNTEAHPIRKVSKRRPGVKKDNKP